MENKVYVVRCSAGEWGDSCWWISGIYSDKRLAEAKAGMMNSYAELAKMQRPFADKNDDDLTDEESMAVYLYWQEEVNKGYEEWKGAEVVEYELNKEI